MNAPSQISSEQATRVIQQYFEGVRPQKDWALEAALLMKGLTLETVEMLKKAARKVTRGKAPFFVLTPTGAGKNRLHKINSDHFLSRGEVEARPGFIKRLAGVTLHIPNARNWAGACASMFPN